MKTYNKEFNFYYLKHLLETLYKDNLITLDEWQEAITLISEDD